jgi:hypothetical protein
VAIAIAMIMTITPIAKYGRMSELEFIVCEAEVGAGELDALLTVAYVDDDEVKYELLPAKDA